jgi:hypothetical protein
MGQLDERFNVRKDQHHEAPGNGGNGRKKKAA